MEAEQENGPAQSPPSRLGLAVNPFLGWLAPVLLAVEVIAKKERGEWTRGSWLWGSLAPQLGSTWPSCYNFGADLRHLARVPPPGYWNFQEMVQGPVSTEARTPA